MGRKGDWAFLGRDRCISVGIGMLLLRGLLGIVLGIRLVSWHDVVGIWAFEGVGGVGGVFGGGNGLYVNIRAQRHRRHTVLLCTSATKGLFRIARESCCLRCTSKVADALIADWTQGVESRRLK